jgi:hypothetical protein
MNAEWSCEQGKRELRRREQEMDGAGGRREYLNGFRGKLDQAFLIRYKLGCFLFAYKCEKKSLA